MRVSHRTGGGLARAAVCSAIASTLSLALGISGCFLNGPSPLGAVHPKAKVFMENATEARFSPDGKLVAYVRLEGGKSWTADVYVLDLSPAKRGGLPEVPTMTANLPGRRTRSCSSIRPSETTTSICT